MCLAARQMKAHPGAEGIAEGGELGAQAAVRAADGLVFANFFWGAGAVLMGAHDGAVDHRILVVSSLAQMFKDTLPDAGFGPAGKAAVCVVPVAKAFSKAFWQIAPGQPGAIAVEDGLDE